MAASWSALTCGSRSTPSVYLELNAKLQMQAEGMTRKVQFLTKGEAKKVTDTTTPANVNRAWENWCRKADRPYKE